MRYQSFFEKYKKKENSALIYISNVNIDPSIVKLSEDFTAQTAVSRSKQMIKQKVDPSALGIIKLKVNSQGELQIVDGNARLLTYRFLKMSIKDFFIVKKYSNVEGIKILLENI